MNRRTSVLDRLVALAAGGILIAAATLTLAWAADARWARSLVSNLDRQALATAPDESWWPTLLAGVSVVCFLAGLMLLIVNLRRARPETMPIFGHAADGTATPDATNLSVDLDPLAVGLAAELGALDGVRSVRAVAVDERGLATLRITVVADPTVDVPGFTRGAEALARSMSAALPGAPVATQVLLHLDPADQSAAATVDEQPPNSPPSTAD